MFVLLLMLTLLSQIPENSATFTEGDLQFTAAVYEYDVVLNLECMSGQGCSREDALLTVEENLVAYRSAALEAKELETDILLFPEDGLGGLAVDREHLKLFAEPTLENGTNPCLLAQNGEIDVTSYYTTIELSCLAKEVGMYISANYPTSFDCQECNFEYCLYNTQVVFDPTGEIVTSYRKYNLWIGEDLTYNVDKQPQLRYFDTPFGRFGLSTCADLLWESPVVEVVREMNIDTLLLPLYWGDFFPHQLSHSCESGWAQGLQVNLMAANIRSTSEWSSGSGLYHPDGKQNYIHRPLESSSVLVVEPLDVHPAKKNTTWNQYAKQHSQDYSSLSGQEFLEIVYGDKFKFIPITVGQHKVKVCTNDDSLCCLVDYHVDSLDDQFSIGVFSGLHSKDTVVRDAWYMEMCSVIKCDPKHSKQTCAQDLSYDYDYLSRSGTVFTYLNISATFSDDTIVYPQVLFDGVQLKPEFVNISPDGVLGISDSEMPGFVSMSLFGRRYSKDTPIPEQFCPST